MQIINGEVYPPTVKAVGVDMHYPPHIPESERFAVGHEAFGLVPGLMMYATIWLREHNRVCDVLKEVHPDWDDERLFQTTRLILIGEFCGSSFRVITKGNQNNNEVRSHFCHSSDTVSKSFKKRNCTLVIMQIVCKIAFTQTCDKEEIFCFS